MNDDVVRLTSKQLRKRNQALKPLGLKICATCQGKAQPLDTAHFYRKGDGWHSECITCLKRRSKANSKRRYQTDAAARAAVLERNRAWVLAHHAQINASKTARRRRQQTQRFARIIRVAQETT